MDPFSFMYGRKLASAAGAAQGQGQAIGRMLSVYGNAHDYRPSDNARMHAEREQAEALERQAAQAEQQRAFEIQDQETAFGRNMVLEKLKQAGRADLQDDRQSATQSMLDQRLTAQDLMLGRRLDASHDALMHHLDQPQKPPSVAQQKYDHEQAAVAAEGHARSLPVLKFLPPGSRPAFSAQGRAEEKGFRSEKRAEEAGARADAASKRADESLALQKDRLAYQKEIRQQALALAASKPDPLWTKSVGEAADAAELESFKPGEAGPWLNQRAQEIYNLYKTTPPSNKPGAMGDLRRMEGQDARGMPTTLKSMNAPVLPLDVLRGLDNSRPYAAADRAPDSPPIPERRNQTFIRDEESGRTVTPDNVRDPTQSAVSALEAKHPAVREKALAEMRANPERFKAMGIDVESVFEWYRTA